MSWKTATSCTSSTTPQSRAPFARGEAAKEASAQAVSQLLRALEAVSALGLFEKLRITPSGVVAASHATLGLVAMERAAVLLLARTPP